MFDIKKIISSPENMCQAIDAMINKEQKLIDAINIMQSIIDNHEDEYKELHEKAIKKFLAQFEMVA